MAAKIKVALCFLGNYPDGFGLTDAKKSKLCTQWDRFAANTQKLSSVMEFIWITHPREKSGPYNWNSDVYPTTDRWVKTKWANFLV